MVIDKVLQCPACKPSAKTISIESTNDGDRLLHCSLCSKRFTQDKDSGFISFFIGARKSEGSSMPKDARALLQFADSLGVELSVLKQAEEFNNRLMQEQGIDDPERFSRRE